MSSAVRILGGVNAGLDAVAPRCCNMHVGRARRDGWRIDEPEQYCKRCGATTGKGGYTDDGCAFCVGRPIAWDGVVRLAPYSEPVDQWIVQMKFHRRWTWATWFGHRLADAIKPDVHGDRTAICPVPMHWIRRMARGYNQSRLIARALGARAALPTANVLKRTRYTHPQTSLPPDKRADNVRDSVAARRVDLTGWHVWLIDDVKTSGATLTTCARRVRQAGARRVFIAVAAVADPHGSDFKSM